MSTTVKEAMAEEAISGVLTYYSIMEAPINRDDIMSRARSKYISEVRMAVMYVLKMTLDLSYPQIGQILDRDHTTVLSGVRSFMDSHTPEACQEIEGYVQARVDRVRRQRRAELLGALAG